MVLASCSSPKEVKTDSTAASTETTAQAPQNNNNEKMTQVLLKTTMGDIVIALYNDTPQHKACSPPTRRPTRSMPWVFPRR